MAKRININTLVETVAQAEGKKVELPIGQIREAVGCTLDALATYSNEEIIATIEWRRKKKAVKG